MYECIDVIDDAENKAEMVAFADRMRYEKFMEAGELYAATHGLIVGGDSATRLLLNETNGPPPLKLDSFQYAMYSGHVVSHARGLGDALYRVDPQGLGHYTTVITKVADQLLAVSVDGRDLFTLTALPVHRGVRTSEVVIPSERPAQFAKNSDGSPVVLQCMGPEIQLISIYADFGNPAKSADWKNLLTTENSLRTMFSSEIKTKIDSAVSRMGGARAARRADRDELEQNMTRFRRAVINRFAAGSGRILVGYAAILMLTGRGAPPDRDRIQVVTVSNLESEAKELTALAKTFGISVSWKIDDPKIPTAVRMRRMVVHTTHSGNRESVLEVFNSASFEAVPYVTLATLGSLKTHFDGAESPRQPRRSAPLPVAAADEAPPPLTLKIGTPFVLMRYKLIDMWTLQVLMRMNAIQSTHANSVLHDMLSDYETIADFYKQVLTSAGRNAPAAAGLIFPGTFVGRLEDQELYMKRAAQTGAGARFHAPYLPASRDQRDQRDQRDAELNHK